MIKHTNNYQQQRYNTLVDHCNNCGKYGHIYHQCKLPIISTGIIAFQRSIEDGNIRYLMICRKDTLGYVDFMRGKYNIYNKDYILNILCEMTLKEKTSLLEESFQDLWMKLWKSDNTQDKYSNEYFDSSEKMKILKEGVVLQDNQYSLQTLIDLSNQKRIWHEPEWGFPKGRRNVNENDMNCALREFSEETGYNSSNFNVVDNLMPFEEIFSGSNYKSYKHRYYLMCMTNQFTTKRDPSIEYDRSEVSKIEWKTYTECLECIRDYNLEKKNVIKNVNYCVTNYMYS